MIELQLQELKLVLGGKGNTTVKDNVTSNTTNMVTTKGGATWGDMLALPASAFVAHTAPTPTWKASASAATYNIVRDWTNDAVNAPPYNGRPIFEIEHGLTAPADKSGNSYDDKSGNSYGG